MSIQVRRDPVEILAATALFHGVPAGDLESLARHIKPRFYAKGSYIFQEGDPGQMLYVVASGQVKIAHLGRGGEEVVYGLLLPGDTFGELALFDEGAVRSADAQATEATECLTLAREPFLSFLDEHPIAIRQLIKLVSRYIRSSDESFSEAAFLDIPGRVAKKLLDLAEAQGDPSLEGRRIRVRLTQRTLAGLVGASRENVNRALSRFVAHGDISQEHGYITIIRPDQLRKRA